MFQNYWILLRLHCCSHENVGFAGDEEHKFGVFYSNLDFFFFYVFVFFSLYLNKAMIIQWRLQIVYVLTAGC